MSEIVQLKQSSILSANKAEMVGMVNRYLEEVAFSGGEPLKDLVLCRKYIFVLEELEKGLKGFAINELNTFDNKETELADSVLKEVESGVKYDFSASDAWVSQKKVVDEANAKLKEIEAFAKACKEKTTIVDPSTGEVLDYFPPTKSSSTTIRVTLK
jgi:hypothetical protein